MSTQYPLGWIDFPQRTAEMDAAHIDALANMRQRFQLSGPAAPDPGPFVNLMELWKHPRVVQTLGFEFPGVKQITGSCVGAGGGNAIFTLACIEVLRLNDPEQLILPFWLYTYGISRMLIGDTSEGEGSLGSAFAEAAKSYGIFSQHEPGLPAPQNTDGLVWGEAAEMKWSNGKAIPSSWVNVGKKHLVQSTDPITSSAEGRDSVRNMYPLTFASPWFMTPGAEKIQGSTEPACVGALSSSGGHQTTILAAWDHPELGLLFFNENQWGLSTYKADPKTGRRSGCWMTQRDFDKVAQSRDGEIYSFSQYDGYPAQYVMTSESEILPRSN